MINAEILSKDCESGINRSNKFLAIVSWFNLPRRKIFYKNGFFYANVYFAYQNLILRAVLPLISHHALTIQLNMESQQFGIAHRLDIWKVWEVVEEGDSRFIIKLLKPDVKFPKSLLAKIEDFKHFIWESWLIG